MNLEGMAGQILTAQLAFGTMRTTTTNDWWASAC